MTNRKIILAIAFGVLAVIFIFLAGGIFETNQAGYFQVKQAAFTGKMTVRLNPGTYFQWFTSR